MCLLSDLAGLNSPSGWLIEWMPSWLAGLHSKELGSCGACWQPMAAGNRAQITGCAAATLLKQQQARTPAWQLGCCAICALCLPRQQSRQEGLCPRQPAAERLSGAKPADKMGRAYCQVPSKRSSYD